VNPHEVEKVKKEVKEEVTGEARKLLRRDAYRLLVGVLTVLASAGTSILVTVTLTTRSEHKLCAVVILSDNAYASKPPTTELGKTQAKNFAQLRKELGCPPRKASK